MGVSTPVPFVMIEYQDPFPQNTRCAVRQLERLADYVFALLPDEGHMRGEDVLALTAERARGSGDILAKLQ